MYLNDLQSGRAEICESRQPGSWQMLQIKLDKKIRLCSIQFNLFLDKPNTENSRIEKKNKTELGRKNNSDNNYKNS